MQYVTVPLLMIPGVQFAAFDGCYILAKPELSESASLETVISYSFRDSYVYPSWETEFVFAHLLTQLGSSYHQITLKLKGERGCILSTPGDQDEPSLLMVVRWEAA